MDRLPGVAILNQLRRSKIRTPRNNGDFIVHPVVPLADLIDGNRQRIGARIADGLSSFSAEHLIRIREQARRELVTAAEQYTRSYSKPRSKGFQPVSSGSFSEGLTPIILSGHQPEFFHPGVWFKNFLLSSFARRCDGISINLSVDHDLCRSRSITVPTGSLHQPEQNRIGFDLEAAEAPGGDHSLAKTPSDSAIESPPGSQLPSSGPVHGFLPFETATWNSQSELKHFPLKVKNSLDSLTSHEPILKPIWKILLQVLEQTHRVGETISRTRHLFEIENGLNNLEIPLSLVCRGPAFFEFLTDLCLLAEPFQRIYNDALHQFRQLNKIRSHSHPVSELVKTDGWIEMPFWIWSASSPERCPLFIKRTNSAITLSDRDQIDISFDRNKLGEQLSEINRAGISIRPRALMTTMFARVFLADLFVHGIGGAKYDELTDRLIEGFYGIQAPVFVTATSTHLLPLSMQPYDPNRLSRIQQEIRAIRFHPETLLSENPAGEVERWLESKRELLADIPPRGRKKRWHEKVERTNQKLAQLLEQPQKQLVRQMEDLQSQRRMSAILESREYSFLLHSTTLPAALHHISSQAADKFV